MLWKRLYNMVWLSSFSFIAVPHIFGKYVAPVHAVLGVAVLVLSRRNASDLAKLPVPDRVKRISKAVVMTGTLLAVVGIVFGGLKHIPGLPVLPADIVGGLHVFFALALLAQSSSLATAYDMWEEKEFGPAPEAAAATTPPASPPPPAATS